MISEVASYDVAVIDGGAVGSDVARDCALLAFSHSFSPRQAPVFRENR